MPAPQGCQRAVVVVDVCVRACPANGTVIPTCVPPPPTLNAVCTGGVWVVDGPVVVNAGNLTVGPTPVRINGNLTLTPTSVTIVTVTGAASGVPRITVIGAYAFLHAIVMQ